MNTNFIYIKTLGTSACEWSYDQKIDGPYYNNKDRFLAKFVNCSSIRLDQIVEVCHTKCTLNLKNHGDADYTKIPYYNIKVATPVGRGLNGISTGYSIDEASYKRLCEVLDLTTNI